MSLVTPEAIRRLRGLYLRAKAEPDFRFYQLCGIRVDSATLKVGDDLLGEKAFKAELFMGEWVQRASRLFV